MPNLCIIIPGVIINLDGRRQADDSSPQSIGTHIFQLQIFGYTYKIHNIICLIFQCKKFSIYYIISYLKFYFYTLPFETDIEITDFNSIVIHKCRSMKELKELPPQICKYII